MRWLAGVLLVATPVAVWAEDARLSELRGMLVPMRQHPYEHLESRGATPELTVVKHKLRDWIESRVAALAPNEDPALLTLQLNAELKGAGLFSDGQTQYPQPESWVGFLGPVLIHRQAWSEFLLVQTAMGIQCGFDWSGYAYERSGDRWRRIWQSEQDDYRKGKYLPQNLHAVLISPTDYRPHGDKSAPLVLTLGDQPWCTSNWRNVDVRLWRTKTGDAEPKLLLDLGEPAYLGSHDPPIQGSVGPDDVLVEYSVAGGEHSRPEIRHYTVEQDKVKRVDPIALRPRDFVEEWFLRPWTEVSRWTEPGSRARMEKRHGVRHEFSEFTHPTLHCGAKPDLWQIQIDFGDAEKQIPEYFLIRWRPPYRFIMVDVSDRPWPGCVEPDPAADEVRTLFPTQDWRE